jgi:hypothetical protein
MQLAFHPKMNGADRRAQSAGAPLHFFLPAYFDILCHPALVRCAAVTVLS